jgi:hypothetical protein
LLQAAQLFMQLSYPVCFASLAGKLP